MGAADAEADRRKLDADGRPERFEPVEITSGPCATIDDAAIPAGTDGRGEETLRVSPETEEPEVAILGGGGRLEHLLHQRRWYSVPLAQFCTIDSADFVDRYTAA